MKGIAFGIMAFVFSFVIWLGHWVLADVPVPKVKKAIEHEIKTESLEKMEFYFMEKLFFDDKNVHISSEKQTIVKEIFLVDFVLTNAEESYIEYTATTYSPSNVVVYLTENDFKVYSKEYAIAFNDTINLSNLVKEKLK